MDFFHDIQMKFFPLLVTLVPPIHFLEIALRAGRGMCTGDTRSRLIGCRIQVIKAKKPGSLPAAIATEADLKLGNRILLFRISKNHLLLVSHRWYSLYKLSQSSLLTQAELTFYCALT